jgi:hypothetical protein
MKEGSPKPRLPQGDRGFVSLALVKPQGKAIVLKNLQSNPGDRIASHTYQSEGYQAFSDEGRK